MKIMLLEVEGGVWIIDPSTRPWLGDHFLFLFTKTFRIILSNYRKTRCPSLWNNFKTNENAGFK